MVSVRLTTFLIAMRMDGEWGGGGMLPCFNSNKTAAVRLPPSSHHVRTEAFLVSLFTSKDQHSSRIPSSSSSSPVNQFNQICTATATATATTFDRRSLEHTMRAPSLFVVSNSRVIKGVRTHDDKEPGKRNSRRHNA